MEHNKFNFSVGDIVMLDENFQHMSCKVEILNFTPNKMFATVCLTDSTKNNFWETMTNRLTPLKQ